MLRRSFLKLLGWTPVAAAVLPTAASALADPAPPEVGFVFLNPDGMFRLVQAAECVHKGDFLAYDDHGRVCQLSGPNQRFAGVAVETIDAGNCGVIKVQGLWDDAAVFTVAST